jgi:hypothetical protein
MGNEYNSMALAPDFNPHRKAVGATSAADVTTKKSGVNSHGFEEALVDAKLVSGSLTTAVFEVMYWSDASAKFVLGMPTEEITFSAAGQAKVACRGRVFYLRCKTLTGTSPVLDLAVAGVADGSGQ